MFYTRQNRSFAIVISMVCELLMLVIFVSLGPFVTGDPEMFSLLYLVRRSFSLELAQAHIPHA